MRSHSYKNARALVYVKKNSNFAKFTNNEFADVCVDGDGELIILSVVEDEDGETYLEPIEDEALFNEIGEIFEERLADYFEFDEE